MTQEELIQRMCKAAFIDVDAYKGIGKEAALEILHNHDDFDIDSFEELSSELDTAKANSEFYPEGTEASARISLVVVCENLRIKPKLADEEEIIAIMDKYNFNWQWA